MTKKQLIFLVILCEGYVVLACELLAIRQLIPFVGSSTEIISVVISAVLLPLAIGYHAGGSALQRAYRKAKTNGRKIPSVRRLLVKNITVSMAILMFGLSYVFLELFFGILAEAGIHHYLLQGVLYAACFLVTPVFLLGQTLPLISNYFGRKRVSEMTGKILFFSTTGSFFGSVFSTIVLMMTIGVHNTVIVTLGLLCLLSVLLSGRKFSYQAFICLGIFASVVLANNNTQMAYFHVVSDNAYNMISILPKDDDIIFSVNRSSSSRLSKNPATDTRYDYVKYIENNFITPLATSSRAPADILIIGAGGFTMGLEDKTDHYTFVDIDPDIKNVAEKYFLPGALSANKRFVPSSARSFLHNTSGKYDLIIIDAYTNVISIPMECTTREFLMEVKKHLKEGGAVVANSITSPTFRDKFSVRYAHTFLSVFPSANRQVIHPLHPWATDKTSDYDNILYMYFNRPFADDMAIYTDNKNTYSLDKHQ